MEIVRVNINLKINDLHIGLTSSRTAFILKLNTLKPLT